MPASTSSAVRILESSASITIANVRALADAVSRELDAGNRRVRIDVARVETIDATALGAIVQLYKAAAGRGADLRLVTPRPSVRRLLAVTRLESILVEEEAAPASGIHRAAE